MIRTENSARMLARKLVLKFYKDHKDIIETHRPLGNIGMVLATEFNNLIKQYRSRVDLEITNSTNFLSGYIVTIILKGGD